MGHVKRNQSFSLVLLLAGHTNIVSEILQDFEVVVGVDDDLVSLGLLMVFIPKSYVAISLLQFVRGSQMMPVLLVASLRSTYICFHFLHTRIL